MRGTDDQRAYDRGSTIFSPDGRLYQVEYARQAVSRGGPVVGVRADDGVVLASNGRIRSPLLVPDSVEKLHDVDGCLGMATAGHVADSRRLVDVARRVAQRERLRYGERPGVETLAKTLADRVQEATQSAGTRPFGTAALVGGVAGGRPRLFETDPSGTPTEWRAAARGDGSDDARDVLEDGYGSDLDTEAAVDLALSALAAAAGDDGLATDEIGLATATGDGFAAFPLERRRAALDDAGLSGGAS